MRRLLLAPLLVVTACSTPRATVAQMLDSTAAERAAGHDDAALAKLGDILDRLAAEKTPVDAATQKRIDSEVAAAGNMIVAKVDRQARTIGPLAGEKAAMTYTRMFAHPQFRMYAGQTQQTIHASGIAACSRLAGTASLASPYWSWLIERYSHFGGDHVIVPELPNLIGRLVVDGSVTGASSGQVSALHASLAEALDTSVWFRKGGSVLEATVSGTIATKFTQQMTTLSKDWTESVPYTDYETVQVPYQEPYDDTETYYEQVPYTAYRSETTSCGDSTCTNQVPYTDYRSESRTRTVTKYRTAYRSETNPVTRYRDEARVFTYQALAHNGRYSSALRVEVPDLGVLAEQTVNTSDVGYDHDVTFSQAGVSPERSQIATHDEFVDGERTRLAALLSKRLDDNYRVKYCSAATFTRETAAQCAYLDGAKVPPPAHAALRVVFGDEEPLIYRVASR